MNEDQALEFLLEHSFFLEPEAKKRLIRNIPLFSPQEKKILLEFLALEKAKSLETAEENLQTIDQILQKIEE